MTASISPTQIGLQVWNAISANRSPSCLPFWIERQRKREFAYRASILFIHLFMELLASYVHMSPVLMVDHWLHQVFLRIPSLRFLSLVAVLQPSLSERIIFSSSTFSSDLLILSFPVSVFKFFFFSKLVRSLFFQCLSALLFYLYSDHLEVWFHLGLFLLELATELFHRVLLWPRGRWFLLEHSGPSCSRSP